MVHAARRSGGAGVKSEFVVLCDGNQRRRVKNGLKRMGFKRVRGMGDSIGVYAVMKVRDGKHEEEIMDMVLENIEEAFHIQVVSRK